ncbi:hypothetical protein EDD11_001519 [Mortierella claussenii]|nr:hypothetical protein EDD11_001519 [Mortierella claussenii]
MLIPHRSGIIAFAAGLCSLLLVTAESDPVIETCFSNGCSSVVQLLDPCGGGATNASLQQDLIYTPTASLGGCECNSQFYNALSSCLACIASQGKNSPEIQNQQDWVADCSSYGFNYTTSATNPATGNGSSGGSGGLSKGAIAGIVIGILALLALLALAGACLFNKRRKRKQEKSELFQQPATAATAGAVTGASAATAHNEHDQAYPASYDQQADYYANQQVYDDPSAHQYNTAYYGGEQQYQPDYQQSGYYGMDGHSNNMMMQNLDHSNGSYVPPPPHPSLAGIAAAGAATGAAAYSAPPRPSDSFPQSLRSKPKGWDKQPQPELTSGLVSTDRTYYNDKTEFEAGEELEPPQARSRYANDREEYTARRSMTPPRANMQSYREEFSRPSFEREPRLSGSDRGSVSGLNNDEFGRTQDSPESARRRARAAELFSAEGRR